MLRTRTSPIIVSLINHINVVIQNVIAIIVVVLLLLVVVVLVVVVLV